MLVDCVISRCSLRPGVYSVHIASTFDETSTSFDGLVGSTCICGVLSVDGDLVELGVTQGSPVDHPSITVVSRRDHQSIALRSPTDHDRVAVALRGYLRSIAGSSRLYDGTIAATSPYRHGLVSAKSEFKRQAPTGAITELG